MTKTELKKKITEEFLQYVIDNFPNYIIDEGEGGRINLNKLDGGVDDIIEYTRNGHSLCHYKWASPELRNDSKAMGNYLNQLVSGLTAKYELENKK